MLPLSTSELVRHRSPFPICLPHTQLSSLRRFFQTTGCSLGEFACPLNLNTFVVRGSQSRFYVRRFSPLWKPVLIHLKDTEDATINLSSQSITRATTTATNKATSTVMARAKAVPTDTKPDATAPAKQNHTTLSETANPFNNADPFDNAIPSSRLPTLTMTAPNKASSTVTTRAKTVLTDAKPDATAPTKRKYPALSEIVGPSNKNQEGRPMGKRATKDKPKEKFDSVVSKNLTTTTSTIRQPLKAVTGAVPQSRKAVISVFERVQRLDQIREDPPPGSDATAIDSPHRAKAEILETKSLRVVSSRKQLKSVETDEEESKRVVKKCRTSSSSLPEVVVHTLPEIVYSKRTTTPEVDPYGDQWDDLDAEGADDPLMVSEYACEIFVYLKEVEVSELPSMSFPSLTPTSPRYPPCLTPIIWRCKRIWHGRCEAF